MAQRQGPNHKDTPVERRSDTRGVSPLVYELFVLGELAVQPMYGYLLHEVADRILGPFMPLSWGTLYPLIKRLEQEGMIASATEQQRDFPAKSRGQVRRVYSITPQGRERFMRLMLDDAPYNRDTFKVFIVKLTKFQFLTPVQRLDVLGWFRRYMTRLYDYYDHAHADVSTNPQIEDGERPWILALADYQRQRFVGELAWIDGLIASCERELSGAEGEKS